MTTNPCTTARDLAAVLDSDPIAAAQIKEYLSEERLIELLGIGLSSFSKQELGDEIASRTSVGYNLT